MITVDINNEIKSAKNFSRASISNNAVNQSTYLHSHVKVSGEVGQNTNYKTTGSVKKGECVVINGRPCKIVDTSTSKTGKHGHAKVNITAIDVITGQKISDLRSLTSTSEHVDVKTTEYSLVDISADNFITIMSPSGTVRSDLPLPDDLLRTEIKTDFAKGIEINVTVISAMNNERVISYRRCIDNEIDTEKKKILKLNQ